MNKLFYTFLLTLFTFQINQAQVPILRKTQEPTNKTEVDKKLNARDQQIEDIKKKNKLISLTPNGKTDFSNLLFAEIPEVKEVSNAIPQSKYHSIVIDVNNQSSKNWQKQLVWDNIPFGTRTGRYEISLLPFPANYDPSFSGIIRSGTISVKPGITSTIFMLNYNDKEANYIAPTKSSLNTSTINTINTNNTANSDRNSTTRSQNPDLVKFSKKEHIKNLENSELEKTNQQENTIANEVKKPIEISMDFTGNGTRKFYIRIIPFDASNKPLKAISNDIILQEELVSTTNLWEQNTRNSAANDYTITKLNYYPVHYSETNYRGCVMVTGYNENASLSEATKNELKQNFPIGHIICPKDEKDKAWYAKTFGNTDGFEAKSITNATLYYNTTSDFVGNSILTESCNDKSMDCKMLAKKSFEYAMTSAGITPTLANIDDLTKMAYNQLADLTINKIENEGNFTISEGVKNQFKKEFLQYVTLQAKKGTFSEGLLTLKPYTKGQFQTAYLEMEFTRSSTKNNSKESAIFSIADKTAGDAKTFNRKENKEYATPVTKNQFESTSTTIPYLDKKGDKTTVYVFLKPQESYVDFNDNSKSVKTITNYMPSTFKSKYPTPSYEGYAKTRGFELLNTNNFTTEFYFGIPVEKGLNTHFKQ